MSSRVRIVAVLLAVVVGLGGVVAVAMQGSGSDEEPSANSAGSTEPDLTDVPEVVATVDGVDITREQFSQSYTAQFQISAAQSQGEPVDQDALKQQVADNLVETQLLIAEAESRDYEVSTDELESAFAELAEQNGQDTAALTEALKSQGLSQDDIDTQLEQQVLIERLVDEEAGDTTPSDEELREVYDQVVAQQGEGGEVPSFEEVKPQLIQQGEQEARSAATQSLVELLREDAKISIAL